ncbi:MAG: cell division protein FtsB [Betaproteobacteria bacterium]|jgi:cell division protein FtsB|uniref:cell division protein FtsB n=1 Tax=Thiomonas TaxID=32012 RepID=UPI002390DBFA|nr:MULTISPECIES: cell division protein FtsB [Thiomonas]MDE2268116.1 cell division protein FtsB [Betaproteobacteria bacterium]HML81000.1 cell division protein FtsB [Thiomonas arsenitoxydans]
MRWVTVLLVSLLLLLQWPLWFGERGWFAVQRLENQLSQQEQANALAQQDNDRLAAEVHDLKAGLGGVQDQARREMGMVKPDEIFVQIVPPARAASASASASAR